MNIAQSKVELLIVAILQGTTALQLLELLPHDKKLAGVEFARFSPAFMGFLWILCP